MSVSKTEFYPDSFELGPVNNDRRNVDFVEINSKQCYTNNQNIISITAIGVTTVETTVKENATINTASNN